MKRPTINVARHYTNVPRAALALLIAQLDPFQRLPEVVSTARALRLIRAEVV